MHLDATIIVAAITGLAAWLVQRSVAAAKRREAAQVDATARRAADWQTLRESRDVARQESTERLERAELAEARVEVLAQTLRDHGIAVPDLRNVRATSQ